MDIAASGKTGQTDKLTAPYTLEWLVEGRVIGLRYGEGVFNIAAISAAFEGLVSWLDDVSGTPHILIDIRAVSFEHFSFKDLSAIPHREAFYARLGSGWMVYVGYRGNSFFQMMTAAVTQQRNIRMRWFEDYEEARDFLRDMAENIP